MKELIEEKAKAYDEVLKKARMFYKDEHVDNEVNSLLEVLFPELKESEDERIREWLIEVVEEVRKANPTNAEHNGMCSEAIAWLEKQGNKDEEILILKDQIESLNAAIKAIKETHRIELEKLGKQKSADTCDSSIINDKEFPASEKRDFGYFEETY